MSVVDRILEELGLGLDGFDPPDPAAEQAVIDLLLLAMLVDGTSADAERERIRSHLDRQDWPDGASPYSYFEGAAPRIRRALDDHDALEALLRSITDRLRSTADRQVALDLTTELAELDGTVDDRESALLSGLRRRFASRPPAE
jgi:uncharacterized tellurite resistance protein B-like protein